MQPQGRVLSIGQGSRSIEDLVSELHLHGVQFLIDVRSVPCSRYRPEFSRNNLAAALTANSLRYVFMGDLLGGRPDNPDCYVDGKVDYLRCRAQDSFRRGFQRLQHAYNQGFIVCVICSEGEPADCHRSKLIGEALSELGIEMQHILPGGSVVPQDEIIRRLTQGQASLFGESFQSRHSYR